MERHINDAITDLEEFRSHPVFNEYSLRIARYALSLGDQEKAKDYFTVFLQSKISIFHYADWIQRYYHDLSQFFNRPVE